MSQISGLYAVRSRIRCNSPGFVHHRQETEGERIGFFFEALAWEGEPVNKEPGKCLALTWFPVHGLPDDIIEYPRAGLLGYLDGTGPLTMHNWT
ncbi:hypothetical protein [Streptomyces sp. NRRL B-3648]|uniref:hypothetical protein n=1 Tax=Streptomyces sp. NRRL B-3648 TaxID=1519493 RepID=UPI000A5CE24D|nr:hypothetical protein [Streptomyces sp. NRRL B-3648]